MADKGPIFVKNESRLALTPMNVSARLEVDWSKSFQISVRKSQFWLIFVCFRQPEGR